MEQHPIPRNVTGFQFQLVGSMTLKQFGYLASGFILAFISFKSPLSFLRLPLAGLFVFLGFALAFLPIQERSLDVWLINFLKSVYAATQFIWQKENQPPEFLTRTFSQAAPPKEKGLLLEQHHDAREKLSAYLKRMTPTEHEILDEKEKNMLGQISSLFGERVSSPVPQPAISPAREKQPALISGLVKSQTTVLPAILIHVRDEKGNIVRLLKSDVAGKFSSSLPLSPGVYSVEIEDPKKKCAFNSFRFRVNGEEIKPWLIKTRSEM